MDVVRDFTEACARVREARKHHAACYERLLTQLKREPMHSLPIPLPAGEKKENQQSFFLQESHQYSSVRKNDIRQGIVEEWPFCFGDGDAARVTDFAARCAERVWRGRRKPDKKTGMRKGWMVPRKRQKRSCPDLSSEL